MKAARRMVLKEAYLGAGFLTAAWYLYYLTAVWGLMDYFQQGPYKAFVEGPGIHVEMIISGMVFGVVLALVNHLSESPKMRQRPFGQIILWKSGLFMISLVVVVALVQVALLLFVMSWAELREIQGLTTPRLLFGLGLYLALSILATNFLLEVRRKVGPGNLWALVTGRYHRPRDENRVFLFLDLKGSTAIAERLGHARYSQFIRHCFHDLTEFVLLFGAQIYQYVGDEVVLTWPSRSLETGKQSLETFFAYQSRLSERKEWYLSEFGVQPEFRAGVEEGRVTVTEVGDIKREIAFHGDALNTAARLLELCREFERPVLVSGRIRESIAEEPGLSTELQGEITLRGKTEPVSVYGVEWSPAKVA